MSIYPYRGEAMITCQDCATNLDDLPAEQPCPHCGSDKRHITKVIKEAVGISGHVGLTVTHGDHRPWESKWNQVEAALESLRQAYNTPNTSIGEAEQRTMTFFHECHVMGDWVRESNPSLKDAATQALAAEPLATCADLDNTDKHHGRDKGRRAVRIRDKSTDQKGARVTIEVDWKSPTPTHHDALDLAESCHSAWLAFFKAHGLSPN